MSASRETVTRRALLAAAVALAGGCTLGGHRHPTRAEDPDARLLADARAAELGLLAGYDPSSPAYAVHLAHLHALGQPPPSAPASSAPLPPKSAIAAERASVRRLQAAATAARRGETAALLASIAAAHACLAGAQA